MSVETKSDYDKNYCDRVAEHLAKNYDKGEWAMAGDIKAITSVDSVGLNDRYAMVNDH